MSDALIGHTGFVGGHLRAQHEFGAFFNSSNIGEIRNQSFETIVHAGTPAVKWWANQNPEEDWRQICASLDPLKQTQAEHVVLISTIDVVPPEPEADESFDCKSLENQPYGRHRLRIEEEIAAHFPRVTTVRLPALFGRGLKKNVIYDLMHDKLLEKINPASRFQYYDLEGLWSDIQRAIEAGLDLIQLVTEPVSTADILERFFADKEVGADAAPVGEYDFRTRHGSLFGRDDGYVYGAAEVLERMGRFIATEGARATEATEGETEEAT